MPWYHPLISRAKESLAARLAPSIFGNLRLGPDWGLKWLWYGYTSPMLLRIMGPCYKYIEVGCFRIPVAVLNEIVNHLHAGIGGILIIKVA